MVVTIADTKFRLGIQWNPLNNGHIGDMSFVHCSEVVPSSEVEMYGQYIGRG